nr:hypothetical protein [Tanacetum cinerariifolium]
MVYGEKATDSSEIKTNDDSISYSHDSVLFDFSDRSSNPSTNDFQTCDSSQECSRPNHSDHDSNDSISSVSAPARKGILGRRPTRKPVNQNSPKLVSVGRPKPVYAGRPKPVSAGRPKPVYVGRPKPVSTGRSKPVFAGRQKPVSAGLPNPVFAGRPNPVSADQPNPVFAGQPNTIFAGDGILGPRPLNFQPKSTYFHSFLCNNQQIIFPITHNLLYSLYMTGFLQLLFHLHDQTLLTEKGRWNL